MDKTTCASRNLESHSITPPTVRIDDAGHRPSDQTINTGDIIYYTVEFSSFLTDANIDASCNRTHYGSNLVVCVGKSILTIYN